MKMNFACMDSPKQRIIFGNTMLETLSTRKWLCLCDLSKGEDKADSMGPLSILRGFELESKPSFKMKLQLSSLWTCVDARVE